MLMDTSSFTVGVSAEAFYRTYLNQHNFMVLYDTD
jgi:hypothetical protein